MNRGRIVRIAAAGLTLLWGLAQFAPVRAQDAPPNVRAKIIIRGPDGEREIEIDPSQLPPPGEGNHIMTFRVGPDGQISYFSGDPGEVGAFIGPGGAMMAGPNGMIRMGGLEVIDPGRSYIHELIKRDDVRSQLLITAKQREALEAMENNLREEMQQQAKQSIAALGGDLKGKSQDELREMMTERAKRMQEQMKGFADTRDRKLAAILTPKQMMRLKELDLQWRGPLAMGVKDVAEQAKLTPQQSPKVTDLLKEYRQEVGRQLNFGARTVVFAPKSGADAPPAPRANTPPTPPASPAEMQAKMEKAKKAIEKAREALGKKALSTLTDDQRTQWSTLTGKPFQFRAIN